MLIVRPEKSSHWYHKNGEAFYEIERKDGKGMRPVRITDAFKHGAYRSVTNVLGVLDKPGLDIWKNEQCVLSALTLPRGEFENEHDFAARVMVDADEQSRKAREAGTRLHELAASWLVAGTIPVTEDEEHRELGDSRPTMSMLLAPFQAWCQSNLNPVQGLVMPAESAMINHAFGYAGRVDWPARMADGSIAIIDAKTQDVKLDTKGQPKPEFYDEWAMQLGGYSRCMFADGSYAPPMPWRLISMVIDRLRPGCYVKEWTDPANPLVSSEPHFQGFIAACKLWTYLKGGTPGLDLKAT